MMKNKYKITGVRVGLILSLLAAVVNLIFLGSALLRRNAGNQLEADQIALQENFTQLETVNKEQLDALQADLELIQAEVIELESSFPELGAPFNLFNRGLELAQVSQLELLSISSVNTEIKETGSGLLILEEYDLELVGDLDSCLAFIERVEADGLDSVVMQYAGIIPVDGTCSLGIKTMGYPTSRQ